MTLEEILVIMIGIFLVIAQLVMWWCQRNVYVNSKYARGRYIKVGGKR